MNIDPKALFWTGALINMLVILGCAGFGIRNVRAGRVHVHKRLMLTGVWLVVLFLVSYVAKSFVLGKEDLHTWGEFHVSVLRFHETCVTIMLIAGGLALFTGLRTHLDAEDRPEGEDPLWFAGRVRLHRRAGRTAVVASALGVASAAIVLYGMYTRLGAGV